MSTEIENRVKNLEWRLSILENLRHGPDPERPPPPLKRNRKGELCVDLAAYERLADKDRVARLELELAATETVFDNLRDERDSWKARAEKAEEDVVNKDNWVEQWVQERKRCEAWRDRALKAEALATGCPPPPPRRPPMPSIPRPRTDGEEVGDAE